MRKNNAQHRAAIIFAIWLVSNLGTVCAQQTQLSDSSQSSETSQQASWQQEQHKAIAAAEKDPDLAVTFYRSAIKGAADAKAPVEKQLGILLQCGDLLWENWRVAEAKDVYLQGIELARTNDLKNWEARFLLMSSCNSHTLFYLGLSPNNDPAPALKALELRPGNPECPTDFHINCLQEIGNAYLDQKDYTKAESFLYDALSEAQRMPDEESRSNEIIHSIIQLRVKQKKFADATRLLAESCVSQPNLAVENKTYYLSEINRFDPETATIYTKVRDLLKQNDFVGLDSYSLQLRKSSTLSASGKLPIEYFLDCTALAPFQSEIEWQKRFDTVSTWMKEHPDSDTAKIAQADLLVKYAWKARGGGWADSVTKEGWRLMQERLDQAQIMLSQVKQRTPDWYSVSQVVALGQSWERERYESLVNECQSRFPKFETVIFKKAYWLQPKWYGRDGEAVKYITAEANKLPGLAGDVRYAQIAWSLDFSFENVITDAHLDWARTKRGLQEIIRQHPDSLRTRGELACLAQQSGDKVTQLSAFPEQGKADSRIKLNPPGYAIALHQGKLLQKADKREAAIAEYTKAIALAPKNGEAYFRRCEMYVMTNRYSQAYADIEKCLSMFPDWLPAIAERGRLENAIEKYPQSIADIERVLAFKPADVEALSTLGQNYDAMGNHQRAIDTANFNLETTEQNDPRNLYYSYQDRGLVWSNAHQYDKAVSDLRKGIALNEQSSSQLWAYLAYVDAATDKIEQAKKDAFRLVELETFAPRSHRLRGEMLRAAGLWDESIQEYSQSTNAEPTYGPGFWQRAVSEIALGNYQAAEADLNQSVALIPTSALAYSYLALVEDLQGKSIESKNHIEKAFALTTDLPINYVNRARIHLHHGELAFAATDCNTALKLDNYLADGYATAAVILATAGNAESAAKFNEAAKVQWWHEWKVPIKTSKDLPSKTSKESQLADISITMPTMTELQPKTFSVSIRDCAP